MSSESSEYVIQAIDFSERIKDLSNRFVGRQWLFAEVEAFLAGSNRSLLVEGEPGSGKSAFSAQLICRQIPHAYHFCIASGQSGTLDPVAFARSIAIQLTNVLPQYGRHLVEQAAMQKYDVKQNIQSVTNSNIYGVYIEAFLVSTRSAQEAFQILLREPLKSYASAGGGQVVLLVDAVDEAARLDRSENIAKLIDDASDLPVSVRWILTSRPRGPIAVSTLYRQRIKLDDDPRHDDDTRQYVNAVLAEPQIAAALARSGKDAKSFEDALVNRQDPRDRGNFLYLRYVLEELRAEAAKGHALKPPTSLPTGLDAWYTEFLERPLKERSKEARRSLIRPVLGVLAAAREALTVEMIAKFTKLSRTDVIDVLNDLQQLLDIAETSPQNRAYRIYHASFGDFLCDVNRNPTLWIDAAEYHLRIAQRATNDLEHSSPYGLRHAATHLLSAAKLYRAVDDIEAAHDATHQLVKLLLDPKFQTAHEVNIADPAAFLEMLQHALRQVAVDSTTEGLSLAIDAARGLTVFRKKRLSPQRIFERARQGDLAGAEQHVRLLNADFDWKAAALMLAAWLAPLTARAEATDLLQRVHGNADAPFTQNGTAESLWSLLTRARGHLDGSKSTWRSYYEEQDCPSKEEIASLSLELTGVKEQITKRRWGGHAESRLRSVPPREQAARVRLEHTDAFKLVAYAAEHPEDPKDYVSDYLAIVAANSYVQYRNRFLWPLLEAVLEHPNEAWAQDKALEVVTAALTEIDLDFEEALPITLIAVRSTRSNRQDLDEVASILETTAKHRCDAPGDMWESFTRRLCALAESVSLLQNPKPTVSSLHSLALKLHYGFAGLQAPAWLCLAESIRICRGSPSDIAAALDAARSSAHNITDPTFCVRTTARMQALVERYWQKPLGFAVAPHVDMLSSAPTISASFAAIHRIGQPFEERRADDLPGWVRDARTLEQLADIFGFPLADFQHLNPAIMPAQSLSEGCEVLVPDPEMVPLVATRIAAEALVDASLSSARERARQIQRLIPLAASNTTALDTVLARFVLASSPLPSAMLEQIVDIAKSWRLTKLVAATATEGDEHSTVEVWDEPDIWVWLNKHAQ